MTETVRTRLGYDWWAIPNFVESVEIERRKVNFKIIIETFIVIYFPKKVLFVSVGDQKGESQDSEGKRYKHLI